MRPANDARTQQRDDLYANAGTPAPTGPDSSVSQGSMTQDRHARLAAAGGPAAAPPIGLDPGIQAGLRPPGPARAADNTGARSTPGSHAQNQRATGPQRPER
ncbi:hypothetical protein OHA18_06230 [Kribbella sp. NBC_00709]|uniref:hypothetical protein n=1 Tax=Kribbella sp. NBC_00709 TaxID=2975972 RepID=UPI002E2AF26C|nr:hypothetical protein [Kribbella sp. NBC_00709]